MRILLLLSCLVVLGEMAVVNGHPVERPDSNVTRPQADTLNVRERFIDTLAFREFVAPRPCREDTLRWRRLELCRLWPVWLPHPDFSFSLPPEQVYYFTIYDYTGRDMPRRISARDFLSGDPGGAPRYLWSGRSTRFISRGRPLDSFSDGDGTFHFIFLRDGKRLRGVGFQDNR